MTLHYRNEIDKYRIYLIKKYATDVLSARISRAGAPLGDKLGHIHLVDKYMYLLSRTKILNLISYNRLQASRFLKRSSNVNNSI